MWSWNSRSLWLLLALASLSLGRAHAWDLALLPPGGDDAVEAAVRTHVAEVGLNCVRVSAAVVGDRTKLSAAAYPVALLAGGERFADTVTDDGDAVATLQSYVDGGGTLIVAASGPVFGRPQRWTGTAWDSTAAPLRRVNLATRFGLLDAGQSLETPPPANCVFVTGSRSALNGRVPDRLPLPADAGPYRPIPGSQDASVEFLPLMTLVDAQGGTYGAGVAEMRRKGAEAAGSTFYIWAPLLKGDSGRDLLLSLLALRAERLGDAASQTRRKALSTQADGLTMQVENASKILPADLKGTQVEALRLEVTGVTSTLRWLKQAIAVGNEEFAASRLNNLREPIQGLLGRAGRAVDAAVTNAVASATGSPFPPRPAPPVATARPSASGNDAGNSGGVIDPQPERVGNAGVVLLVPDPALRADLPPPVTTPGNPANPGTPGTGPNPTPPTPPTTTPPVSPGTPPTTPPPVGPGTRPTTKPMFQTANPVLEFDIKDRGKVYLELLVDAAPRTCSSMLYLARAGFYERTYFHRRIEKFVVQGGDPFTKDLPPDNPKVGTGGPEWTVPGEFSQVLTHQRGTVGLARAEGDPDSGGSQFYICLEPQPALDREYCVFAKVIQGMEIVDKIQIGDRIVKVRVVQGADATNPPNVAPLDLFKK